MNQHKYARQNWTVNLLAKIVPELKFFCKMHLNCDRLGFISEAFPFILTQQSFEFP